MINSRAPSVKNEESLFRDFAIQFATSYVAIAALALLACICFAAIFASWISPQNPYDLAQLDILDSKLRPGSTGGLGQYYILGTDDQGRDLLSAIIYGLRISLLVGVGAAGISFVIGSMAGLVAAYFGGRIESLTMRLVDLQLSFPAILIAMMILAVFGRGILNIIIALVIVEWAYYARTARASAISERRKEYVEAATSLAYSHWRIMLSEILPNCMPPLIVVGTIQVARSITLEATLSFLGIGVPITEPSLGLLIANGAKYMLSGEYWMSLFPGLSLLATVVLINLVGDHVRNILNPRLKGR